jgi:BirA family biotin operon repressor/biotin-[acetyl-CoA-carboxylase] ligase
VLLRPRSVAPAALGWLPLLAGVAVVQACGWRHGVDGALKWPNDLLVRSATGVGVGRARPLAGGWGKCGGILAEAVEPGTVVVGIGINVSQAPGQLPAPADPSAYPATSLAMAGVRRDREDLAVAVLRGLSDWYGRWLDAGGDATGCGLREAYRRNCATLGQAVTVLLPGGRRLRGTATDIDPDGRLEVATGTGEQRLAAGDVHHVRARPRRSRQRVAQGRAPRR